MVTRGIYKLVHNYGKQLGIHPFRMSRRVLKEYYKLAKGGGGTARIVKSRSP